MDDAIPPSQNMIIDVGSQCTSISALTSSVALCSDSTVTNAKSVADDMVKSLQLLESRELQSEAFQLAMSNPVFKQLFEKYNNQPATMCNGMPTPTDSALRKRKSRRKQDTIDSIINSINSFCNDKDKNSLMQVILDSPKLRDTVVAAGYIKNDDEVKMALQNIYQRNRILACASTSTGKSGKIAEEKSSFVNSVLIANTLTPPFDGSKSTVKLIDEVKKLPFSKSTSYRKLNYARKIRKVLISGSGVSEWSGKKYGRFTENWIERRLKNCMGG